MSKSEYSVGKTEEIITQWLERPENLKIVDSFMGNPNGTFLIDPTQDSKLLDIALDWNDDFPGLVKRCIILLLKKQHAQRKNVDKHLENIRVKISTLNEITMQQLGPSYEGTPITFACQVLMLKKPQTYTKRIEYHCRGGHQHTVYCDLVTKTMPEKVYCNLDTCDYKGQQMQPNPNSKVTSFLRRGVIQEPIEEAKHGSPRVYDIELKDDDVETTFIGQRKKVVGNFRSIPNEAGHNDIVIQAINVMGCEEPSEVYPEYHVVEQYKRFIASDNYLVDLLKSFAPIIYAAPNSATWLGKLAVILSILGGEQVDTLRGNIHSLLIGGPSTGKSKILEFVKEVTSKSDYVNGATASGAGVTIAMDQDLKIPRAGALPMCTRGQLAVDEISRFKPEDLDKFLQSMESGRIAYHKGGWNLDLEAMTAIIAGANPRNDVYDFEFGILDNIKLPKPLVARFDLKVNIMDTPNQVQDELKIEHINIIRRIGVSEFIKQNGLYPANALLSIFNYMRDMKPVMEKDAEFAIKKFWLDMRQIDQAKGAIALDTRFYEAIYRCCTAWAKLHMSEKITLMHVQQVVKFYKDTLATFGMETEKEVHQLPLVEKKETKETAFEKCIRTLEHETKEVWFDESIILENLVAKHPTQFPTIEHAAVEFSKWTNDKRLLKRSGKYKLS